MAESIAVLDYGGQYVQNIARAFREMAIPAHILSPGCSLSDLPKVRGIVLSGGPYSVYRAGSPSVDGSILDSGVPVLGLCYGHQLIAEFFGGVVHGGKVGEYGFAEIRIEAGNPLFDGVDGPQIVWMSHGDQVAELPDGFISLAWTPGCPNAAICHRQRPIYGLQFHPEVSHTPNGWTMLRNFAREICGLQIGSWDPESYLDERVEWIRETVGDRKALVAVSGGVDSTVVATLARRALGDQLLTVHVDHGLMREDESSWVLSKLAEIGLETELCEESDLFLEELRGVGEGDAKRKKIGELFIETFQDVADANDIDILIQGTIAPDSIESSRGMASRRDGSDHGGMIKLHHNVGGLPDEMWIEVLEPIKDLFKYQVRMLGRALGVPADLLERQPFPGPGLAVRISGPVTPTRLEVVRGATVLVEEGLREYDPDQFLVYAIDDGGTEHPVAESLTERILGGGIDVEARIHDDIAVGVKGDERQLGRIISLSVSRGGEACWDSYGWLDLLRLQSAITGEIPDACRVVATLAASDSDGSGAVVRAVETRDFMTAMPCRLPFTRLYILGEQLTSLPGISSAYYEITTKPSATIELE